MSIKGLYSAVTCVLYTNIDQKLVNSLHRLLNCEIGGLDCHIITTEYRTRVHCIHYFFSTIYASLTQCVCVCVFGLGMGRGDKLRMFFLDYVISPEKGRLFVSSLHSLHQLHVALMVKMYIVDQIAGLIFLATRTTSTFKRFSREFISIAVFSHAGVTFFRFHKSTMLILVLGCTNLHRALTMCSMFRTSRFASLSGVVFAVLMSLEPTNIRMRRASLTFLHKPLNSCVFCAVPALTKQMKVLRDQNPTIEVYTEVVRTDESEKHGTSWQEN